MKYEEIRFDVSDPLATITLDRPEFLNAWTNRMGAEFKHALARAEEDERVVAIVITGAGRGFCAGADLRGLQAISDGLVELNLSIGSLKQNWDTRERIRLENATKFMWADLAQLRVVVYKQIPGSFPSLVDPVRRRLFTLQDRFPEGTLKPPLLPKPQSIIDDEERRRARQAQAGAQP